MAAIIEYIDAQERFTIELYRSVRRAEAPIAKAYCNVPGYVPTNNERSIMIRALKEVE